MPNFTQIGMVSIRFFCESLSTATDQLWPAKLIAFPAQTFASSSIPRLLINDKLTDWED